MWTCDPSSKATPPRTPEIGIPDERPPQKSTQTFKDHKNQPELSKNKTNMNFQGSHKKSTWTFKDHAKNQPDSKTMPKISLEPLMKDHPKVNLNLEVLMKGHPKNQPEHKVVLEDPSSRGKD